MRIKIHIEIEKIEMGGNALSQPSVRLDSVKYSRLVEQVSEQIMGARITIFKVIPAYDQKPDFGDMDILIHPGFDQDAVSREIDAVEHKRNGDVTSYGIRVQGGLFQIDLIRAAPEHFDFSLGYFSFNDLGNLIGRVAHKAGFKLGHRGLFYVLRDQTNEDQVIGEIMVTQDWSSAIKFFGFDPMRFSHGFSSLDAIFSFASSSPCFNKEIYQFDNMNHISRARDRKRPTYNKFLQWVETKDGLPTFDWSDKNGIRMQFLGMAISQFDGFGDRLNEARSAHAQSAIVKEKFNGVLFAEITGLTGKDIGMAIKSFKDSIGSSEEFKSWVIESSQDEIHQKINQANTNRALTMNPMCV